MNADNNQVCINININFKVRKTNTLFQNDYVDSIELKTFFIKSTLHIICL